MASTFEKMIQDFSKKDTTKLLEKENGDIITATTYSADTELADGGKAKMLSIRIE